MKRKSIPFFLVPDDGDKNERGEGNQSRNEKKMPKTIQREEKKERVEMRKGQPQPSLLTQPINISNMRNLSGLSIEKVKVNSGEKEEKLEKEETAKELLISACGQKFKKRKYLEQHRRRKGCEKCLETISKREEVRVLSEFCMDTALLEPKIEIKEEDVEINLEEAVDDDLVVA